MINILEIRNVNEQDAGSYTCLAENLAGKAKQNLQLQVLGKYPIDTITYNLIVFRYFSFSTNQ